MQPKGLYQALLDPACYPERPRRVFARDTHISRLYFTPRHVYKLKKPVDFGFLDFTSLDRRRFFCDEENRLNSHFAPDTYLGTVPVRVMDKHVAVGGEHGKIVDYAVKMRRLPQAQMLDRKIRRHSPELRHDIERLVPTLNRMFGTFSEVTVSEEELFHRLAYNCEENLSQTREFIPTLLAERAWQQLESYTHNTLSPDGLKNRFLARAKAGYFREGHGDLHSEHICMTSPIRIYDCIEFNLRFRINDLLSELAFLLMDLDFRCRRDLSQQLLNGCSEQFEVFKDGETLNFYRIYRAWVRGKVAALTSKDLHTDEQKRAAASVTAQQYFALALGYLCRPFLTITCGLMGSGKSLFAQSLARVTNATVIRSDEVRKVIHGRPLDEHDHSDYGEGLYAANFTDRTYMSMLEQAEEALRQGNSVIVDASFGHRQYREQFALLSKRLGTPFLKVWFDAPHTTLHKRLELRSRINADVSDGRGELLDAQKNIFNYPKDDDIIEKIDSEKEVDYNVQLVLSRILTDHGWQP